MRLGEGMKKGEKKEVGGEEKGEKEERRRLRKGKSREEKQEGEKERWKGKRHCQPNRP